MNRRLLIAILLSSLLAYECQQGTNKQTNKETGSVDSTQVFDTTIDEKEVKLYHTVE